MVKLNINVYTWDYAYCFSVVPLPNDNSSSLLLKNVYNSSVEAHKVSQLVLKNKTTISVLNTWVFHSQHKTFCDTFTLFFCFSTYACPQNSTNCTQKAKKLVPLVTGETVKLSNATSNKTLEGANGGVIDFFKRYFTWWYNHYKTLLCFDFVKPFEHTF